MKIAPTLPIAAFAASPGTHDDDFVRSLGRLFPNGGLAARHALAAGMRPDQLWTILCPYPRAKDEPTLWPALMFRTDDGGNRTFRPCG